VLTAFLLAAGASAAFPAAVPGHPTFLHPPGTHMTVCCCCCLLILLLLLLLSFFWCVSQDALGACVSQGASLQQTGLAGRLAAAGAAAREPLPAYEPEVYGPTGAAATRV
jgi:hypothetical protein